MAKTQIFENKEQFDAREDKSINGVSKQFAKDNPNWEEMNETNQGCWDCLRCTNCTNCTHCTDCRYCKRSTDCTDCKYCNSSTKSTNCIGLMNGTDCNYCNGCTNCTDCTNCDYCARCTNCYCCFAGKGLSLFNGGEKFAPPKIENIHQKVYDAASQDGALDMADWHTCDTTHCRAGWAVALAGEDGAKLESKTSTLFAAMMIYKASSDIAVPPSMFYVSNEEALEDMKRCAELEKSM